MDESNQLSIAEESKEAEAGFHTSSMNPRTDEEAVDALLHSHLGILKEDSSEERDRQKLLMNGVDLREEEDDSCEGVVRYHCDSCGRDISTKLRVRCATCLDFDLCIECFTSGKERNGHKRDHSYIPVGRHTFPLFTKSWTADEELALLEGVSRVGLGNWNEVAETVSAYSDGPAKKRDVVEAHFYEYYFNPDVCEVNLEAIDKLVAENPDFDIESFEGTETLGIKVGPKTKQTEDSSILGPDFGVLKEEIDNKKDSSSDIKKEQPAVTSSTVGSVSGNQRLQSIPASATSIVGHMPLRGDFDVEYDNDAELVLADMEFHNNETPYELELKLQIVEIFNSRLDERILRKRTVLERGLLDIKKIQQQEKKKTKEEKDLSALLRPLTRFALNSQIERLVPLVIDERRLRQRLRLLAEWQSAGLKSHDDVRQYEENKRKAETIEPSPSPPSKRNRAQQAATNKKSKLQGPASSYPGARLCDAKELAFCDKMQLPPVYYLMVKHIMLKEEAKRGSMIDKESFSQMVRLDAVKVNSVYEFVLESVSAAKARDMSNSVADVCLS